MSAYVKIKDLTRVFDVSKPWLNRVLERRSKALLTAVSEVSLTSASLRANSALPPSLRF